MDQDRPGIKKVADILKTQPPKNLPPDFAVRVVSTALGHSQTSWQDRFLTLWHRLFHPRQIWIRPAWQIAWALILCFVSAGTTGWLVHRASSDSPTIWVRFAIKAPQAHQVALAGDFNAWKTDAIQLDDSDGDGLWHVIVPLNPGVYQYMFLIDDQQWIADPLGGKTIDDGFGQKNSLLKVVYNRRSKRDKTTHAL